MRKPSKSFAKRTKLEPLSVEEALSAPAVEGMFSFLNIRPEELLHHRPLSDVVRQATPLPPNVDTPRTTDGLKDQARVSIPGAEVNSSPGLEMGLSSGLDLPSTPRLDLNSSPGLEPNNSPGMESHDNPGLELNNDPGSEPYPRPGTNLTHNKAAIELVDENPEDHAILMSKSGKAGISSPGLKFNDDPGLELTTLNQERAGTAAHETTQGSFSIHVPGKEFNYEPGLELDSSDSARSLLVSQVRYTIRRARLVQDGHTSNEQKLYEYLWTHGNPYDDISRQLSIGFRTLAEKVRMARASAQKNLRALGQKLALEVIEGFDVTSSKAPTYRVFNYIEILRRREMAGMIWYVRRTQAVRFVDGNGQEILRPIVTDPGLILVDSPGPIFNSNPGPILEPPPGPNISSRPGLEFRPALRELEKERRTSPATSSTSVGEPAPEQFSQSLNELLPFIDDQAVRFLWTECRSRVADCSVTEVIYFTKAKAAVLASGKIQNPIGFLLTAVPKCFEGQSFLAFRRALREQTDAEAKLRRQREEAQRQAEEDTQREIEAYTRAEETLNSMSQNDRDLLRQNVTREYLKRYPSARHMLDFESWIRRMMIREIVKKPGGFSK